MEIEDITRTDFEAYEIVRTKGVTNMLDMTAVHNWSGILARHTLTEKVTMTIIKNYGELKKKYPVLKPISEILKIQGWSEKDGKLIAHLSPIPNWYGMMDGKNFECPRCSTKRVIKYPADFKRGMCTNVDGVTYQHRALEFGCRNCKTIIVVENYD